MKTVTMLVIEIVFLLGCWLVGQHLPLIPEGWFFPLLGLAAFRGGRAIAFNGVFKWLRDLLDCKVVKDSSGAGDSTEPNGTGIKHIFGELVCCPICAGTWFGLATLAIWIIQPGMGRALIYIMAAAGVAEVLHWLSEYLGWGGRAYREQAGTEWIRKNERKKTI